MRTFQVFRWFTLLKKALPLLLILLVAAWLRFPMLSQEGYSGDMDVFKTWTEAALQQGLLAVYHADGLTEPVNHPPVDIALFTLSSQIYESFHGQIDSAALETTIKLPILIFDLLLIAAAYLIALQEAGLLWACLLGILIAFTPAFVAATVWWGQTDGIFTFFLVLTVYGMYRRWQAMTWLCFACAMLTKFQAVILIPLLVMLTWRRFGIKPLFRGLLISGGVMAIGLMGFILVSGSSTLRPYVDSSGRFPYVTLEAENFWYWSLSSTYDMSQPWYLQPNDTSVHWGLLSARTVGFLLFGCAAAIVMLRAYLFPENKDEFLLAAALYVAFFMLFTQMHERYLYPGAVLLTLALIHHRWLGTVWLGFAATATHNILEVAYHYNPWLNYWWQVVSWTDQINADLNMLLMVILFGVVAAPILEKIWIGLPRVREKSLSLSDQMRGCHKSNLASRWFSRGVSETRLYKKHLS